MIIIGLTGGIASGKTTVTKLFKAKQVPVIDCDQLARQVVEPGQPALQELVEMFGEGILSSEGLLNRSKLAKLVFNDEAKRQALNDITHHYILEKIYQILHKWRELGEKIVVIDIPLLIEVDWAYLVDEIWLVYCTPQQQLERLIKRSNYSVEEAQSRIKAQMDLTEKRAYADVILDNSGTLDQLTEQFEFLWSELLTRS